MSEVKLQLVAGKKYVDRRGRVFGPLVINGGLFGESADNYTWHSHGRVHDYRVYDIDLVAEYVEPVAEGLDQKPAEKALKELAEWAGILVDGKSPEEIADALIEENKKWVELCDPEHVLRSGVDEYFDDGKHFNKWMPILASAGKKIKDCPSLKKFRCQLEDLPQLSLVKLADTPKPAPVVESPDDWVTQDRVPSRRFTDEFRWVIPGGGLSTWAPCVDGGGMHGERRGGSVLEIRCRRKDLPPLPPTAPPADIPPTTLPVRLWVSHRITFEGGDWPIRCSEQIPSGFNHHVEIKVGPNGFYVELPASEPAAINIK